MSAAGALAELVEAPTPAPEAPRARLQLSFRTFGVEARAVELRRRRRPPCDSEEGRQRRKLRKLRKRALRRRRQRRQLDFIAFQRIGRPHPKAASLGVGKLTREEREEKARIDADPELLALLAARPRERLECADGPRPCPYASCRLHLAIDVTDRGAVKRNFPHLEIWQMTETCALDVAERGGVTLEEVGDMTNVSMQAASQTLGIALRKLREVVEGGPEAWRAAGLEADPPFKEEPADEGERF